MDLVALATNFGIPAAISLYLVWWLTQRHEKSLKEVREAITNQTKVLNHTLTKLINKMDSYKKELKKETEQRTKKFLTDFSNKVNNVNHK